jgi:hypothetical protein
VAADVSAARAQCREESSSLLLAGPERGGKVRAGGSAMTDPHLLRLLASRGVLSSQ